MNWYKTMVEVIAAAFLAACAILGFLVTGVVLRVLWEGLTVGFTMFGYWPV